MFTFAHSYANKKLYFDIIQRNVYTHMYCATTVSCENNTYNASIHKKPEHHVLFTSCFPKLKKPYSAMKKTTF